jgi:hypothetical protein
VASATARFVANVDLLVFALRADVSDADRVDVELDSSWLIGSCARMVDAAATEMSAARAVSQYFDGRSARVSWMFGGG